MKFYKVLSEDNRSCNGGHYQWTPPVGETPSAWTPKVVDPSVCDCGWHLVPERRLNDWARRSGRRIYLAEGRGKFDWDHGKKKIAYESVRLLKFICVIPENKPSTYLPYSGRERTGRQHILIYTGKQTEDQQDEKDHEQWLKIKKQRDKREAARRKARAARIKREFDAKMKVYRRKVKALDKKKAKWATLADDLKKFRSVYQYGEVTFIQGWCAANGMDSTRKNANALSRLLRKVVRKPYTR